MTKEEEIQGLRALLAIEKQTCERLREKLNVERGYGAPEGWKSSRTARAWSRTKRGMRLSAVYDGYGVWVWRVTGYKLALDPRDWPLGYVTGKCDTALEAMEAADAASRWLR